MYSRLLIPQKSKSFFLFGPRGTGKSSWAKTTFPKALYLDLLESEIHNDLLASPQRLEKLIPKNHREWIIIDEVQRIPDLLNEIHRLIEKNKFRFVLTGSSARSLRKKGTNLLAGRALHRHFHPLTAIELGKDFDLRHSLQFGQLPSVYVDENPKAYLESYVKTYLREEVQQEGLTRNLSAFSRFLEAASFSQGSVLNVTAIASECSVERKVVENYFGILEDLLLSQKIPVFTKRAKRRMASHPKFYFFDVGVYRTLRPRGPLDLPEEAEGPAFETLVLQNLRAINDSFNLGYEIFYWRTSNDLEVDFILYGPRGIKAIEVKRTGRVKSDMLKGLRSFLKDYPMAEPFFVYGGDRQLNENGVPAVPIEVFLKTLQEIL